MKKKLIIATLATVASLCLAFGIAGCADSESESSSSKWGDVFTIEAAYAQAEELGYTGSLEEFIAEISGTDGKDGVGIANMYIENGNLYVVLDDYTVINCGVVTGADGKDGVDGQDGKDGVGISTAYIGEDGHLYIKLDNGNTIDCGKISTDTASTVTACSHEYGEWQTVVEATCTSIGYDTRTCSLCGDIDYKFTTATGHSFSDEAEYEVYTATHTSFCSVCGTYIAESHDFDDDSDCETCGLGLKYELNSDGKSYTVIGVTSESTVHAIVIPDKHNGLPVTAIKDDAFSGNTTITSVTIGNSVTSIGNYAFNYCTSLTSVTIGNGVTSIGDGAFYNCTSLTSVTIGNNVTTIGEYAFYNCTALTSVTIPDGVTSIGNWAFAYCTSLTSITIPNSVTSIGYRAFQYCTSLTSITIPNSVTSIGSYTFAECTSLESVTIGNGVKSIGNYAFSYCSALTSVTMGSGVTSIGDYAFQYCSLLTDLTIPDSVTTIGYYAFWYCTALTSITIPDSVSSIGNYAFRNCYSLTEIIVTEGNANYSSEDGVLFNKDKTELITYPAGKTDTSYAIPNSVISIGDYAFYYNTWITSVTLTDNVTTIGNHTFAFTSLTSVTIPSSVTYIAAAAFRECYSLTEIIVDENNEYYCDVDGVLFNKEQTQLITYPAGKTATSYVIPDSVTSLARYSFSGSISLESVTIPDSVTSIGDRAFTNCELLISVIIPANIIELGTEIFRDCTSLTTVYYGGTAENWYNTSLSYDSYLTEVTIYYYSESAPTEEGNYWHYVDGVATAW